MDETTILIILAALHAVSEALSMIPALKSNGLFQLVYNMLKFLVPSRKK